MKVVIEIPEDKIPTKQCYKEVLIKFVDKQVCEATMIGQIPREDETRLWFDVLPKGHGDLIDRNWCLKMKCTDLVDADGVTMYAVPTGNILRMIPVVPAEKGEE